MDYILNEPFTSYLSEKQSSFAGNLLAGKFRNEFPKAIRSIIIDKARYKVVGSPGKSAWAECPWIAILDTLVTNTPQSGYYPVFLFKADMSGAYLSLNQGVTEVKTNYKKDTKSVLKIRAQDFRAKIETTKQGLLENIELKSKIENPKLYEAGNIIAKYYSAESIPSPQSLQSDILYFLNLYEDLTFNDTHLHDDTNLTAIEKKQYRFHFRIERNSSIANKVKVAKGYVCEACNFDFKSKYGVLGSKFIEAHHLTPVSFLNVGKIHLNLHNDFAVLCSNCHSMIHKLEDPSDVQKLKELIEVTHSIHIK